MCIAFFGFDLDPSLPSFILASNRDEFWNRPTEPLHVWTPSHPRSGVITAPDVPDNSSEKTTQPTTPAVLAGRDLEKGGTWLGLTHHDHHHHEEPPPLSPGKHVRLALLTNVREPADHIPPPAILQARISRGELVTRFLTCSNVKEFVEQNHDDYPGFNLLVGCRETGYYYLSNRGPERFVRLQPGKIYGLCNGYLDEPWEKVVRGKQMFQSAVDQAKAGTSTTSGGHCRDKETTWNNLKNQLWNMLTDEWKPQVEDLPDTGIGQAMEICLSSIFVQGPEFDYGTRCSTLILETPQGWQVEERTYQQQEPADKTELLDPSRDFELRRFEVAHKENARCCYPLPRDRWVPSTDVPAKE